MYLKHILFGLGLGVVLSSYGKPYQCKVTHTDFIDVKDKTRMVLTDLGAFAFDSDEKKPTVFDVIHTPMERAAILCGGNAGCTGNTATRVTCAMLDKPTRIDLYETQFEKMGCMVEPERWFRARPINSASSDINSNGLQFSSLYDSRSAYVVNCRSN